MTACQRKHRGAEELSGTLDWSCSEPVRLIQDLLCVSQRFDLQLQRPEFGFRRLSLGGLSSSLLCRRLRMQLMCCAMLCVLQQTE